jgi:predicted ArsR family transcriptional regulator
MFDARTHARRLDPATSHDAAKSMKKAASLQCAQVLNALRSFGIAGAEEIGNRTGMPAYAVRKRLADLEHAGLARPTDVTRKTSSGRSERYWRPK